MAEGRDLCYTPQNAGLEIKHIFSDGCCAPRLNNLRARRKISVPWAQWHAVIWNHGNEYYTSHFRLRSGNQKSHSRIFQDISEWYSMIFQDIVGWNSRIVYVISNWISRIFKLCCSKISYLIYLSIFLMCLSFVPQGNMKFQNLRDMLKLLTKMLLLCSNLSKATFILLHSCELPDYFFFLCKYVIYLTCEMFFCKIWMDLTSGISPTYAVEHWNPFWSTVELNNSARNMILESKPNLASSQVTGISRLPFFFFFLFCSFFRR